MNKKKLVSLTCAIALFSSQSLAALADTVIVNDQSYSVVTDTDRYMDLTKMVSDATKISRIEMKVRDDSTEGFVFTTVTSSDTTDYETSSIEEYDDGLVFVLNREFSAADAQSPIKLCYYDRNTDSEAVISALTLYDSENRVLFNWQEDNDHAVKVRFAPRQETAGPGDTVWYDMYITNLSPVVDNETRIISFNLSLDEGMSLVNSSYVGEDGEPMDESFRWDKDAMTSLGYDEYSFALNKDFIYKYKDEYPSVDPTGGDEARLEEVLNTPYKVFLEKSGSTGTTSAVNEEYLAASFEVALDENAEPGSYYVHPDNLDSAYIHYNAEGSVTFIPALQPIIVESETHNSAIILVPEYTSSDEWGDYMTLGQFVDNFTDIGAITITVKDDDFVNTNDIESEGNVFTGEESANWWHTGYDSVSHEEGSDTAAFTANRSFASTDNMIKFGYVDLNTDNNQAEIISIDFDDQEGNRLATWTKTEHTSGYSVLSGFGYSDENQWGFTEFMKLSDFVRNDDTDHWINGYWIRMYVLDSNTDGYIEGYTPSFEGTSFEDYSRFNGEFVYSEGSMNVYQLYTDFSDDTVFSFCDSDVDSAKAIVKKIEILDGDNNVISSATIGDEFNAPGIIWQGSTFTGDKNSSISFNGSELENYNFDGTAKLVLFFKGDGMNVMESLGAVDKYSISTDVSIGNNVFNDWYYSGEDVFTYSTDEEGYQTITDRKTLWTSVELYPDFFKALYNGFSVGGYNAEICGVGIYPSNYDVTGYEISDAELTIAAQPSDVTVWNEGDTATFSVRAFGNDLTYVWEYSDNNGKTWKKTSVKTDTYQIAVTKARAGRLMRCLITSGNGTQEYTNAVSMNYYPARDYDYPVDELVDEWGAVYGWDDTLTVNNIPEGEGLTIEVDFDVKRNGYIYGYAQFKPMPVVGPNNNVTFHGIRELEELTGKKFIEGLPYENVDVFRDSNDKMRFKDGTLARYFLQEDGFIQICDMDLDKVVFTLTPEFIQYIKDFDIEAQSADESHSDTEASSASDYGSSSSTAYAHDSSSGSAQSGSDDTQYEYEGSEPVSVPDTESDTDPDADAVPDPDENFYTTGKGQPDEGLYDFQDSDVFYYVQWKGINIQQGVGLYVTGVRTSQPLGRYSQSEIKIMGQQGNILSKNGKSEYINAFAYNDTSRTDKPNLTYNWYYSDDEGKTWTAAGSYEYDGYEFTYDESMNGRLFRCIVTSAAGSKLITHSVKVSTAPELKVASQPVSVQVSQVNGIAAFFTVGQGSGLSFRWYYSDDGVTWNKTMVKEPFYFIPVTTYRNGRQMYCEITDKFGDTVKTDIVTMSIVSNLAITSQPESVQVAKAGDTAAFTVKASGAGLTYKWEYSDDGVTWKATSVKTDTYSIAVTAARDGRQMRCTVTDATGKSITSEPAAMTIAAGVEIVSQTTGVEVSEAGMTAAFEVVAKGEGLTYKWEYSDDGKTWKATSVKTNTYSIAVTAARDGRQMRCTVTDANGNTAVSQPAAMTIAKGVTIVSQPESVTVAKAGDTASFTVKAEGEGLTYKWEYSDDGKTWKATSVKTDTYTIAVTTAREGRQMRCTVTDANGNAVTSDAAAMTIAKAPVITSQPKSVKVAKAGDTAAFTVQAEGNGITYKWQYSDDGKTWKDTSAKTDSYSIAVTSARNGRQMRCVITDANGNTVTSDAATMSY